MLVVFIKSLITFFLVLIVVRLMGKRQLGEMQPFELVITFIIAEVACIPMNDPYIPFYYGIVPIITLGVLHLVLSVLARKSILARKIISGRSVIAIDKNGINYENLKKMNVNVNDLIEAVRSSGYMDFADIEYAIFETNGKVCVVEKECDPTQPKPAYLPLSLLVDGKFDKENLELAGATEQKITEVFLKNGIKNPKEVLYTDVRQDGTLYVSPKYKKCFTQKISIKGGENW
ncbi:DUF421 domain-containing protein [Pumilibacter intestinalis]|uniref:DUF421 domain-containing protein n=1 Tax=Pumilibacter intestinalis TaxID=2941511 RepID=UPI00203DD811|nr:DUF421 domain-containing protein [Pumilibacter intestinalis]